jgi:hypothetical protein
MGVFNKRAQAPDRKQSVTGFVPCTILDISEFYSVGRVPPSWNSDGAVTLYTNPQEISRSLKAVYGTQNGLLTSTGIVQYGHSDRSPVKLSGLLIDTQCKTYDATPYLDQLEKLTQTGTNSYPPVLAIVWGGRVMQPVVLTSLTVTETAWVNGLVAQASTELEFQYLPPISYRSNNTKDRLDQLTEREMAKAKKLAAEKLDKEAKEGKKPAEKPASKTNPKTLTVDPKTGQVKQKPSKQSKKSEMTAPTIVATFTRGDLNA